MIQTNKKVNKTLLLNRKNIIFNISSLDFFNKYHETERIQ
jgi:hypothetical protein